VPADVVQEAGGPDRAAAAVTSVSPGSPADEAGLQAATASGGADGQGYPSGGDLIVAVDGEAVESAAELQAAIAAGQPGESVTLTVVRDGSERQVEVVLGSRPS
jgi:S1-C subfamily serine protease